MEQTNQQSTEQNPSSQQPLATNYVHNKEPHFFDKHKILLKAAFIMVLLLLFIIPQSMISSLIRERKERQQEVEMQIEKTYSGPQVVAGPVIMLPYAKLVSAATAKQNATYEKSYAYIMPEQLNMDAKAQPSSRRISLFTTSIFSSQITTNGTFGKDNVSKLNIANENIYWGEAKLLIGISDFKGLQNMLTVNWDGKQYTAATFSDNNLIFNNALQIPVEISAASLQQPHQFSYQLALNGSRELQFIPVGNETNVNLNTSWATPRFMGNYPASYNKDFAKKPIVANWHVLGINRSFPQQWKEGNFQLQADTFGINFLQPIDTYGKTMRSVKYAMLIILLTFLVYFFIELMQKKSAHPIQYAMVGFAMVVFYLLLLSISELLGFNAAYLLSAICTIALIALYSHSIFKIKKTTAFFTIILSTMYLFIYILIQLEDSALLVGSIGLFAILAAVMLSSRKISWNGAAE